MPRINFVLLDGVVRPVEAAVGESIMRGATFQSVPENEAECGGLLNCATCHVYFDEAWLDRMPPMTDHEDEMLDGTVSDRPLNSRLSCQLAMTDEMDGVVVAMPDRQT